MVVLNGVGLFEGGPAGGDENTLSMIQGLGNVGSELNMPNMRWVKRSTEKQPALRFKDLLRELKQFRST